MHHHSDHAGHSEHGHDHHNHHDHHDHHDHHNHSSNLGPSSVLPSTTSSGPQKEIKTTGSDLCMVENRESECTSQVDQMLIATHVWEKCKPGNKFMVKTPTVPARKIQLMRSHLDSCSTDADTVQNFQRGCGVSGGNCFAPTSAETTRKYDQKFEEESCRCDVEDDDEEESNDECAGNQYHE